MTAAKSALNTLLLYRGLLRSLRFYPSRKKDKIASAIKEGTYLIRAEYCERLPLKGRVSSYHIRSDILHNDGCSAIGLTSFFRSCSTSGFAEFREKRNLSGKELEKALWLGQMELKRLQAWVPTGKQMNEGKDMDMKL